MDLVDKPNGEERRLHTKPIPRIGGILVFLVIIVTTLLFYHDVASIKYFIAGAIIIFLLGLVDDIRNVKWNIKFLFQTFGSFLLLFSFYTNNYTVIKFLDLTIPPGLDYLIMFFLIVGLLNSFNLLDGMDGLVSGYSLIIALMCLILSYKAKDSFTPFLASTIIGTTLGFLIFNRNPAKIFLGDSGSLTLGYFITFLVILISAEIRPADSDYFQINEKTIDLSFIIISLALPMIDTLRVLFIRIYNKNHPFLADKNHLHHLLYSKNISHKRVVFVIHLISIGSALIAISYFIFPSKVLTTIVFIIFSIILFFINNILDAITSNELFKRFLVKIKK